MGASWAVLEHRKAEKATKPKSVQNHRKIDDFGLSGLSCEASWRPLGASWRPLGPSWGHLRRLGALFGRVGGLLGPPGALLGRKARVFGLWSPSWAPLGSVLGLSWTVLGVSSAVSGPSWGPLGSLLARLGALLGASWAVLEHRKAEKATKPKSVQNHRKIDDFGLSGLSCEASWRPLGASWRPLGPSWGHLRRLGALFGRVGGLLGSLGGLLGHSWRALRPWETAPRRKTISE